MQNDNALTEISIPIPPRETNTPIGPGAYLRTMREERRVTLEEMAKRIHLSYARLMQLENDDYQFMGAPAFAKGYLRAYASQLGIAKEEILTLLHAFEELNLGANIQHNRPELIHEKIDQVSPRATRWITYFILIGSLIGIAGYVWHNHANTTPTLTTHTETSTSNTQQTPAPVDTPPTNLTLPAENTQLPPLQPNLQDTKTLSTDAKETQVNPSDATPAEADLPPKKLKKKIRTEQLSSDLFSSTPLTRSSSNNPSAEE